MKPDINYPLFKKKMKSGYMFFLETMVPRHHSNGNMPLPSPSRDAELTLFLHCGCLRATVLSAKVVLCRWLSCIGLYVDFSSFALLEYVSSSCGCSHPACFTRHVIACSNVLKLAQALHG